MGGLRASRGGLAAGARPDMAASPFRGVLRAWMTARGVERGWVTVRGANHRGRVSSGGLGAASGRARAGKASDRPGGRATCGRGDEAARNGPWRAWRRRRRADQCGSESLELTANPFF